MWALFEHTRAYAAAFFLRCFPLLLRLAQMFTCEHTVWMFSGHPDRQQPFSRARPLVRSEGPQVELNELMVITHAASRTVSQIPATPPEASALGTCQPVLGNVAMASTGMNDLELLPSWQIRTPGCNSFFTFSHPRRILQIEMVRGHVQLAISAPCSLDDIRL
jgi:hypothetical protein